MKQHTSDFKNQIKEMGRELQSIITYGNTELINELYSIKYTYDGNILKSVMKGLEVECSILIPKDAIINYKLGLKIEDEYEYLDYGNYVVKDIEKLEDTGHYKITCYDKILYSMKQYEPVDVQYPVTIREYITAICDDLNIDFANEEDTFANYNRSLLVDPYEGLEYTYRDILDELAQVTGSAICINKDDELEIRYINNTQDTIDERYLKDVNVAFADKYGPVNSIVLSRSGESDNVFIQDGESVALNGLCEIKIVDNQIMNFNDRSDYLPDLLEKLDGLEYYINDFSSTGICYYDLLDIYNVNIQNTTYKCLLLNDEIYVQSGLEEIIHTDMPEQSETDYTKADKTDRKINQTYLIVDKQNQEIESLITQIGDRSQKQTSVTQDIDSINIRISDIEDLKKEVIGNNPITLENCLHGNLLQLKIRGNNTVFDQLYPANDLYPANNLYPRNGDSILIIKHYEKDEDDQEIETIETIDLGIREVLRQYSSTVYDEFIYDYEDEEQRAKVIRRVGVTSGGTLYPLAEEVIEPLEIEDIILTKGKNILDLNSPYVANMYARYVELNGFTNQFATTYEVESAIIQLSNSITLLLREKVNKEEVIAELNLEIAEGLGVVTITGNRVVINSDYFNLAADGTITATNGDFSGKITANSGKIGKWNLTSDGLLSGNSVVSGRTYQSGLDTRNNNYMLYAGLDLTDGQSHTLDESNAYIKKDGTMYAKYFEVNGELGYFLITYNSGRIALHFNKSGITWRLDDTNNGTFASLNCTANGTYIDLYDSPVFHIYDAVHAQSLFVINRYRPEVGVNEASIDLKPRTYYFAGTSTGYEIATRNDICDRNAKKNINETKQKALERIDKIDFVEFDWDNKKINRDGHIDIGFIAQDLEKIDSNYVEKSTIIKDGKKEELYTINNLNLLATSLKAIQELNEKVKQQQEEINQLREELNKLKGGIK